MPQTQFLDIQINGESVDLPAQSQIALSINYSLEEPEQFQDKQAASSLGITLPATTKNDQIFNSFHSPDREDMTTGEVFRDHMEALVSVNGTVVVLKGLALLQESGHTELAEDYVIDIWGSNGQWLKEAQITTLWDCVNPDDHIFEIGKVEASWAHDGTVETEDYVYAPVRYRQPFGDNDDIVNIYHLRPAIFIYWLLVRGFRLFGFTLKSAFMDTTYFRRMVMPWTWGDFYDINNQVTDLISFKAAGAIPVYMDFGTGDSYTIPPPNALTLPSYADFKIWLALDPQSVTPPGGAWTAVNPQPDTSLFYRTSAIVGGGTYYLKSATNVDVPYNGNTVINMNINYRLNNTNVPSGRDDLALWSFDESTGIGRYNFNIPPSLVLLTGRTLTARFRFNFHAFLNNTGGAGTHSELWLEYTHYDAFGTPYGAAIQTRLIDATNGAAQQGDNGCTGGGGITGTNLIPLSTPWIYDFEIAGMVSTDYVEFRLYWVASGTNQVIYFANSLFINGAPTGSSGVDWQYLYSYLEMTGLQVDLSGTVNMKNYDAFRSYKFLDLLGGLCDMFDLEVQTDAVNKVVTIEPMFSTTLPGIGAVEGYFEADKVNDWTDKQDLSKRNVMTLFSNFEQEVDFTYKQDGADGAQNIWGARYKGVYLNNIIGGKEKNYNNTNNAAGIVAAVPGASRYILPDRFNRGNRQKVNRFFSALMHVKFDRWKKYSSGHKAPQLPAIFPENINDSSASAVTQIFEPKIAYYKGQMDTAVYGGWYWEGQPDAPYNEAYGTSFPLPYMFAVNYIPGGENDPVLSYCDQNINGALAQGLMKRFFLQRLAIMRNGQLYKPWMRLNLNDITNWEHRETLLIKGSLYALIAINGYHPLHDESAQCTMWKIVRPQGSDIGRCFPSYLSVITSPVLLSVNDLRYAPLLVFTGDLPLFIT